MYPEINFYFLEKGPGIISSPYFVFDFARKMFLVLYSINWPNCVVWLRLEILDNMCISIVCFPGCDVRVYLTDQAIFLCDENVNTKI